ncbi:MAG: cytochrome P450 [Caldilineaceae bacterium]
MMSETAVAPSRIAIALLTDLPLNEPVDLSVSDVQLVAIHTNDGVRLYEGRCLHQGTLLGEGTVEGNELVCRAHGWRYDVATGARIGHPRICLQPFTATIQDGQVWVDHDQLAAWRRSAVATPTAATTRKMRAVTDLPGPAGVPLLGNLLQIDVSTYHQQLERWSADYGPIYRYQLAGRQYIAVSDPDLIAEALHERPDRYRRFSAIESVFKEMGVHGVFSAEKEEWRRYRKLAMEALSNRHLRQFFPTLHKVLGRLKTRWERSAAQAEAVDVQKDLMRFTVDVTTTLAFGIDMNTVEDEGRALQRHLEKLFPMLARRVIFPFAYWRYFKLAPDRELDKALAELDRIVSDLVAKARQRMVEQPELFLHPTNFLEAMLAVQEQDEERFTDTEIVGNVYTMLAAGEDTTANTLAWMLHLLCQNPDSISKARAEIDAVLGSDTLVNDVGDVDKLVYVDAVSRETMRLRPVAPIIAVLETNEATSLGDLSLPQGIYVTLLGRPGTRRADHFADPLAFRPERWLEDSTLSPHDGDVSMPFGSGPRLCPGRNLALLEIKAALAMILRNFDIVHASDPAQVDEVFAFSMVPTNLRIRFTPRA